MQLLALSDFASVLVRAAIFLLPPLGVLVWALIGKKAPEGAPPGRRRRWRWAIAAVAAFFLVTPFWNKVVTPVRYYGPWALAPNWLLIRVVERQGWPAFGAPWDFTPSGWDTTAAGVLANRLTAKTLSEAQLRHVLSHVEDQQIVTRATWPRDVPLRVRLSGFWELGYAASVACQASFEGVTQVAGSPDSAREPSVWIGPDIWQPLGDVEEPTYYAGQAGESDDQFVVTVRGNIDTRPRPLSQGVIPISYEIRTPLRFVDSMDEAITPEREERQTAALRRLIASMTLLKDPRGWLLKAPGYLDEIAALPPGDLEALEPVALGIRAEISDGAGVRGVARWWIKRWGSNYYTFFAGSSSIPIEGELPADLLDEPPDSQWTVRIIGDAEFSLRDFDRDRYWAGEFTVPLSQLKIELAPQPSANASGHRD